MARAHFRLHAHGNSKVVREKSVLDDLLGATTDTDSIFVHNGEKWTVKNINSLMKHTCQAHTCQAHTCQARTGPRGPIGARGPTGESGDPGNDGLLGPRGQMGIQGLQGHTGPMGPPGIFRSDKLGKSSVYVGHECGEEENSVENTYIGFRSGTQQSGGLNTFIGTDAGRYSSGTQNTYVGNNVCGSTGSNGSYNLYAGAQAGYHNTTGFGNVFLGAVAGASNKQGSWNVFAGQSAGHSNEVGTNNVFLGTNSGISSIAGNSCVCIGDGSDTSSDVPINQIVIGQGVVSTGDNTLTFPKNLKSFPNGTEVNFSNSGGGCLYPVSSSIRWKENVTDIKEKIDTTKIYDLRPVTFNPATGHGNPEELCIGLIAEEVDRILPNLVPKDDQGKPSSVRYSLLSVLLLEEIIKINKDLIELKNKLLVV